MNNNIIPFKQCACCQSQNKNNLIKFTPSTWLCKTCLLDRFYIANLDDFDLNEKDVRDHSDIDILTDYVYQLIKEHLEYNKTYFEIEIKDVRVENKRILARFLNDFVIAIDFPEKKLKKNVDKSLALR